MARDQSMIGDVFLWLHLLKQTEQIICSIAPLKDLFLQCFTIEIKSKCSRHSISNSSANIRRGRLLSGGTTGVRGGLSPINPACRFNFLGFFFWWNAYWMFSLTIQQSCLFAGEHRQPPCYRDAFLKMKAPAGSHCLHRDSVFRCKLNYYDYYHFPTSEAATDKDDFWWQKVGSAGHTFFLFAFRFGSFCVFAPSFVTCRLHNHHTLSCKCCKHQGQHINVKYNAFMQLSSIGNDCRGYLRHFFFPSCAFRIWCFLLYLRPFLPNTKYAAI